MGFRRQFVCIIQPLRLLQVYDALLLVLQFRIIYEHVYVNIVVVHHLLKTGGSLDDRNCRLVIIVVDYVIVVVVVGYGKVGLNERA